MTNLREYTTSSTKHTDTFLNALLVLPSDEWKVFQKHPDKWEQALQEKNVMVAERVRLGELYDGYDPKWVPLVQKAFRALGLNPERSKRQLNEIFAILHLCNTT